MKISEIESKPTTTAVAKPLAHPKTPDQLRLDGLKTKKNNATQQIQTEKKRQSVNTAKDQLATAQNIQINKPTPN